MTFGDEASALALRIVESAGDSIPQREQRIVRDASEANEGYEAIALALGMSEDCGADIPTSLLQQAYSMLDDEDKSDYAWLKDRLAQ